MCDLTSSNLGAGVAAPSSALIAEKLIAEMRTIAMVAGQCSVEGPEDGKALMAAAESERCSRWADELSALLISVEQMARERDKAVQWADLVGRGKSPCGHWKAYAVTEDGGKHITCLQCDLTAAESSLAALRDENETLRMQLVACGVAALGNTREALSEALPSGHPYYSASYGDVLRSVTREVEHRESLAALRQGLETMKAKWRERELSLCRKSDAQGVTQYANRLAAMAEEVARCADDLSTLLEP